MNESLSYILTILSPIAFVLGAILTAQVWVLRKNGKYNPVCAAVAFVLLGYQTRNFITVIAVHWYSIGLQRPTGLLVWSLVGRLIEIVAVALASLYFAGKIGK